MSKWIRTPTDAPNAVEVGKLDYGDFAIRNNQFRARTVVLTRPELWAFIQAAKNGHFDKLLEEIR